MNVFIFDPQVIPIRSTVCPSSFVNCYIQIAICKFTRLLGHTVCASYLVCAVYSNQLRLYEQGHFVHRSEVVEK